jgi:ERCC4-related helicase
MTGASGGAGDRRAEWERARVVFATPHVVANDLRTGRCAASAVVALVVDECHRAQGGACVAGLFWCWLLPLFG